jgi:LysM repeat protein
LGAIARRFGVSVAKLRQWNGLSGNRIIAGRYLVVDPDGRAGGSRASRASSGSGSYTIRRGDTLGAIAQRHGVSIAQLRAWNGLRGNHIVAGRRLVVGAKQSAPAVSAETVATRTPNTAAAKYRVRAGDNLASIGQRFDVSVAELMAWNNLRSTSIQAGRYLVVSPQGAAAKEGSLIGVANAASEVPPPVDRYKIRPGDNLASIAKRYKVSVGDLQRWNGLRGVNITAGDYLTIRPDSASGAPPSPSPASSRAAASSTTRYRIQRGDTLDSIARRFGVSVAQLRAWNGLRGSRIAAGRYLIVNGSQAASGGGSRQVAAAAATSRYQIRRGDSLEAIAQRFGVTVAQLKAWNSLRGSRIVAGDYLVVGSPERAQAGPGTSGS